VLLKNRYKKRLLYRVVCNLDSLLYNGAADPRVARGGGLDEGIQAHLRNAAKASLGHPQHAPVLAGCGLRISRGLAGRAGGPAMAPPFFCGPHGPPPSAT